MPKIVDHAQRREDIAHVACKVVATYGFEQATVARIARAAGYTTGMVAHYFDSKQDIILAALRLMLLRMEERLTRERTGDTELLEVLSEALAIDAQRFTECAFWMAFWGQVSADKKVKRLSSWVHREYMRLYARCFIKYWSEWSDWSAATQDQVLRSVATFVNGLTASAVTSPRDWPALRQVEQLELQLRLLRQWARASRGKRGGR